MSILSEEERLGRARIFFGTLAQIFPETNVYFNDVIIHLGMEYITEEDYSLEFEMGFEKEKNSRNPDIIMIQSKSENECNTYITVFAEICEQYGYLPVIEIDQNALKQILEKTQGNSD